jgi:uncharacterized protein involved in outer membrane biogenesis
VRFLLKLVIYPLALLALVAAAGVLWLDRAVEYGIETVGTRVTRVAVTLDGVGLSVFSGQGALRGLAVANPPGFRAPRVVRVGEVFVVLRPLSVFSDRVRVRSVAVQAPEIHLEKRDGKSNLEVLQANVTSALSADKDKRSGKKLQIDSLVIRDAKVFLYDKPGEPPKTLTLKEIQLRDLGKGPEGITGAELTRRITDAIVQDVAAAAAKAVALGVAGSVVRGLLGLGF